MKIKLPEIKKKFKKGGIHINPNVYWNASLLVGVAIVMLSIFFGIYLFKSVNQEIITPASSTVPAKMVNKDRLDKTLESFSIREQKSLGIINSPSPIVDPSL